MDLLKQEQLRCSSAARRRNAMHNIMEGVQAPKLEQDSPKKEATETRTSKICEKNSQYRLSTASFSSKKTKNY